jgi:hypothetical protein
LFWINRCKSWFFYWFRSTTRFILTSSYPCGSSQIQTEKSKKHERRKEKNIFTLISAVLCIINTCNHLQYFHNLVTVNIKSAINNKFAQNATLDSSATKRPPVFMAFPRLRTVGATNLTCVINCDWFV